MTEGTAPDYSPCKNCGCPYTAHKWQLPAACKDYKSSLAKDKVEGK
jgi:hypothetical protein